MVHNGYYLGLENNIFNEILDNNNITKDEIYAFINIGAHQKGKILENKICAVTEGGNLTYFNITSQLPGDQTPLSITGMEDTIDDLREIFKIQPNTPMVAVFFNYHIPYIVYTQALLY